MMMVNITMVYTWKLREDLKISQHKKKGCNYIWQWMLTILTVAIISQIYTNIESLMLYTWNKCVNYTPPKKEVKSLEVSNKTTNDDGDKG